MTRSPMRLRITVPLVVGVFVVAACAGGRPGGSAPVRGTEAAPTNLAVAAACELLTDADIEAITGATVVSKADNVADTVYVNHCRWTLKRPDGGTGTVDLGILSPGGRERYDHSGGSAGLDPIDGLPADAAGTDATTGSIFAVRGDTLVDVFTLSLGTSTSDEVALAKRVLEHLFGPASQPTQAAGGSVSNPCDLLTDAEILDVTGHAARGKAGSPGAGIWDAGCTWEVEGAGTLPATITVTLKAPAGRASWEQYMVPLQAEFTAISGLGDAAFAKVHWPTHVLAGDTYFSVQFTDFPDPEDSTSTELARRVIGNLGA